MNNKIVLEKEREREAEGGNSTNTISYKDQLENKRERNMQKHRKRESAK